MNPTSATTGLGACRLNALLAELAPGGMAKEINGPDVDQFLEALRPATWEDRVGYDLAVELLDDIRRVRFRRDMAAGEAEHGRQQCQRNGDGHRDRCRRAEAHEGDEWNAN